LQPSFSAEPIKWMATIRRPRRTIQRDLIDQLRQLRKVFFVKPSLRREAKFIRQASYAKTDTSQRPFLRPRKLQTVKAEAFSFELRIRARFDQIRRKFENPLTPTVLRHHWHRPAHLAWMNGKQFRLRR